MFLSKALCSYVILLSALLFLTVTDFIVFCSSVVGMKYAGLQKFDNVERHQIWAVLDKKFIGKPKVSLIFAFFKAN